MTETILSWKIIGITFSVCSICVSCSGAAPAAGDYSTSYPLSDSGERHLASQTEVDRGLIPTTVNTSEPPGWLGVSLRPHVLSTSEGEERTSIRVQRVFPNSPAALHGILRDDQIRSFENEDLQDIAHLVGLVQAAGAGRRVRIGILRQSEPMEVEVLLDQRPDIESLMANSYVGHPAPALVANRFDDHSPLNLQDYHGRVVVLDFWATWCGPCRSMLPELNSLRAEFPASELAVIGISAESPQEISQFLEDNQIEYTLAYDLEGETTIEYMVGTLPTVFLIDGAGRVREVLLGALEAQQTRLWVERLLTEL